MPLFSLKNGDSTISKCMVARLVIQTALMKEIVQGAYSTFLLSAKMVLASMDLEEPLTV